MQFVLNPLTGFFDVISGSGSSGTGDVNGPTPAFSTDNAVVRWDGITGKLIQNSNAILDDNGTLHVLAVLQQNVIPTGTTVTVAATESYIIGSSLSVDGSIDLIGTMILL